MSASKTRLEPGEHSIDRVTPFEFRDGYAIAWSIRLHSGRLIRRRTQGRTKGEARARARVEADKLLTGTSEGTWKGGSSALDYLEKVVWPEITSKQLKETTQRRYSTAYRLLRGECANKQCKHKHSMQGLTLHDAMRPRALKSCLEEIAKLHGRGSAEAAETIARKYLAESLRIDEIIEFNPLLQLNIDYSQAKKPNYSRGGRALTLQQFQSVIEYLLELDPTDVEPPKRGRWTLEHRITERQGVIDIVLTQATTGLRTSELCLRPVSECRIEPDNTVVFELSGDDTKTKRSREVPVLEPAVSERLITRMNSGSPWLFPSPSNPAKVWDPRNRDRKLERFYTEIGEQLGIQMFIDGERGHSWRTTGNTLLYDALPEATRVRLFGHTPAVNRQHYTAVTSTEAILEAASILRSGKRKSKRKSKRKDQDSEGNSRNSREA